MRQSPDRTSYPHNAHYTFDQAKLELCQNWHTIVQNRLAKKIRTLKIKTLLFKDDQDTPFRNHVFIPRLRTTKYEKIARTHTNIRKPKRP